MRNRPRRTHFHCAYLHVSSTKLLVLSVCTWGIYEIYWAWRCWEYIRYRDSRRLNPFWRSIFISHLFFNFLLFWDVYRSNRSSKPVALGWAASLGLAYAAAFSWNLLFEGSRLWALTFLQFLVLVPVQMQINEFNAAERPDCEPDRRFSAVNVAATLIGGILLLLMIVESVAAPA